MEFLSSPVFWSGLIILVVIPLFFRHREKIKLIERGIYEHHQDGTTKALVLISFGAALLLILYSNEIYRDWFLVGLIPIFAGFGILGADSLKIRKRNKND